MRKRWVRNLLAINVGAYSDEISFSRDWNPRGAKPSRWRCSHRQSKSATITHYSPLPVSCCLVSAHGRARIFKAIPMQQWGVQR